MFSVYVLVTAAVLIIGVLMLLCVRRRRQSSATLGGRTAPDTRREIEMSTVGASSGGGPAESATTSLVCADASATPFDMASLELPARSAVGGATVQMPVMHAFAEEYDVDKAGHAKQDDVAESSGVSLEDPFPMRNQLRI